MQKCEYCKRSWLEADEVLINDTLHYLCQECNERRKESGEWMLMQQERHEKWKTAQSVLKTLGGGGEMSEKITRAIEVKVEVEIDSNRCGFSCRFRRKKEEYCCLFDTIVDQDLSQGWYSVRRCPECLETFKSEARV